MSPIDLRSDTVTRPGPAMRQAIAEAPVGDDVYDEDPTIHELQARVARLLGKESALFVPSGTMANQLAVRCHTRPGDQVLLEAGSHIFKYEAAAPAVLSGVQLTPIPSEDGSLTWEQVGPACSPDDVHCPPARLLCVENTHNSAGGRIFPLDRLAALSEAARANGLRVHLDGARLWNAAVATGIDMARWGGLVDTVSVCFSKGMGAPVGSLLAGDRELIARARRARKQWGGGMRQVGVLGAACLYALDHHLERLTEDHENARVLASSIDHEDLKLVREPETNILLYDLPTREAVNLVRRLRERGVLVSAFGRRRVRLVTHLGVSRDDCARAAARINELDGS